MLAVRFDGRPKWSKSNVVAILISLAYGRKRRCEFFECSNKTIKTRFLDDQFLRSAKVEINYCRVQSDAERKCVEMLESELRQRIANGFSLIESNTSDDAPAEDSDEHDPEVTETIRISLNSGRTLTVSGLDDYLDARISVVMHSDAKSASILAHGIEKKTKRQVTWVKEELLEDCEFSVEFLE